MNIKILLMMKLIKRLPPSTSGNIHKFNNSNEIISNEFNNSVKQNI